MLNNVSSLRDALRPFEAEPPKAKHSSAAAASATPLPCVAPHVARLSDEADAWLGALVRCEAARLLAACGLAPVLRAVAERDTAAGAAAPPPPATCAGLEPATLAAAMRSFYSSLFALAMPDFDRLHNPRLAAQARQKIAHELADAHATVRARRPAARVRARARDAAQREDGGYTASRVVAAAPRRCRSRLAPPPPR